MAAFSPASNITSFGFIHKGNFPFMALDSIGRQVAETAEYRFDGNEREDRGHVIFQYTLSGEGWIELEGTLHRLPARRGFFVKVPSQHCYYYKAGSPEPWDFVWLNLKGEDALRMWDRIIAQGGPLIELEPDSPALSCFWRIFALVSGRQLNDASILSLLAYEWILTVFRAHSGMPATPAGGPSGWLGQGSNGSGPGTSHPEYPPVRSSGYPTGHMPRYQSGHPAVALAKSFMRRHYAEPLALEDIAAHSQVNPHYLCRLFQRESTLSPLEYLRNRRLEAAAELLRSTDIPASQIGRNCGFNSPSYFGKLFRHFLGQTPAQFRANKHQLPHVTLLLDE